LAVATQRAKVVVTPAVAGVLGRCATRKAPGNAPCRERGGWATSCPSSAGAAAACADLLALDRAPGSDFIAQGTPG
jgi:hypothetical protein